MSFEQWQQLWDLAGLLEEPACSNIRERLEMELSQELRGVTPQRQPGKGRGMTTHPAWRAIQAPRRDSSVSRAGLHYPRIAGANPASSTRPTANERQPALCSTKHGGHLLPNPKGTPVMPNPPIPDKDGYFGREFTYTEVEQEYLEAIFHMQIRALAFSRVGTEAIRHHLSKGEKLDYVSQIAPAQFAVKALHFCNGLFLNCNDNAKPEELRSLTAIMDRAIECSTVDEFEDILHRLRDDLTRQVQARMEVRTQRRAAARCN